MSLRWRVILVGLGVLAAGVLLRALAGALRRTEPGC
jgi:hypothetical protein